MEIVIVLGVIIFLSILSNIWEKLLYPYFMTRDMNESEKEIWLDDYYESLPDCEEI